MLFRSGIRRLVTFPAGRTRHAANRARSDPLDPARQVTARKSAARSAAHCRTAVGFTWRCRTFAGRRGRLPVPLSVPL